MASRKLLIGLGNPGEKFEGTRHNFGIRAVRLWLESQRQAGYEVDDWRQEDTWPADVARVWLDDQVDPVRDRAPKAPEAVPQKMRDQISHGVEAVCLFPLTFMNMSGEAVGRFVKMNPFDLKDIIIVHDDIELPLGQVRLKDGGSAAGHKGVLSIHEALGTRDVRRLRLGTGRPPEGVSAKEFVLGRFTPEEENIIAQTVREAGEALSDFVQARAD